MAGQPKAKALARRIKDMGGDEAILDRIADGETVTSIAKSLGVSSRSIYSWKNETPERSDAWEEARKLSAPAHAEGGLDILEEMAKDKEVTTAQAKLASDRANHKRWLASVFDREQFGEDKQTQVVNIAELHLNALRKYGGPEHMKGVEEARVLSEESGGRALPSGPGGLGKMENPYKGPNDR